MLNQLEPKVLEEFFDQKRFIMGRKKDIRPETKIQIIRVLNDVQHTNRGKARPVDPLKKAMRLLKVSRSTVQRVRREMTTGIYSG